jgi:dipeptidyl aminopeptidase/acylaminoacyl peptidase
LVVGGVVAAAVILPLCGGLGSGLFDTVEEASRRTEMLTCVAYSPDGGVLAAATPAGEIQLIDASGGQVQRTWKSPGGMRVTCVAFSPDGKTLGSAYWDTKSRSDRDTSITLWNVDTGEPKKTLRGHQQHVAWVTFSPDGKLLASASYDNTAKVWDIASGEAIRTFEGPAFNAVCAAFSPDSATLAVSRWDGSVILYDVQSGDRLQTLGGHSDRVLSIAFSPEGDLLASASNDKTVRLWEVANGRSRSTLDGHQDFVTSVAFSPDGQTLASASWDNTVRLWDVAGGELRDEFSGQVRAVFSPDGETLATISADNVVKLIRLRSADVVPEKPGASTSDRPMPGSDDGTSSSPPKESKAEPGNVTKSSFRMWTDSSGQYRTEATFVEFKDGKLRLKKRDGRETVVPIERLSDVDQEYVRIITQ